MFDFTWPSFLFWLANVLLGAVMWGTQVPPHQARSNAAAWAALVGLHPSWLRSKNADRRIFHAAATAFILLFAIWLAYSLDFPAMKLGPKILLVLGCLFLLGAVGWNFVDTAATKGKSPGGPAAPPVLTAAPVPAPPLVDAPAPVPDGFLSFEDAIRLASDRLNDLEYFSLLNLGTRDSADGRLLGWANRLKSRTPLYDRDRSPMNASAQVQIRDGKVFVGDVGDLTVKKEELENALTRARLDYPNLSRPGANAINSVDSPNSRIIGNKAGEINVHRGPGTDILNNDVRDADESRRDPDKIYQAGTVVGQVFGGRRHPNDATRFTFVEISRASQFNLSAPFQYQGLTMKVERLDSRVGMSSARPQDGMILGGVTAVVVGR